MTTRKHFLLLGAGFTRNWGGWLASEVFEYLLGCERIADDDELLNLLWDYKINGEGFEAALAYLQARHQRKQNNQSKELLDKLQASIVEMFRDMNLALETKTFEFSSSARKSMGDFLGRFDAIFTLNQDLLLERHYRLLLGPPPHNWSGITYPGISAVAPNSHEFLDRYWQPNGQNKIPKSFQPIFKLHGSSNWKSADGSDLLIMGGNKSSTIQNHDVLKWYGEEFAKHLRTPNSRLMIIGYSFGDGHINKLIQNAGDVGLRFFVIDPFGSDVIERVKWKAGAVGYPGKATPLERMLIGASRRSLKEIIGSDEVEYAKVTRFFSA